MRQWFDVSVATMCTEHLKRELMETRQVCRLVRGEWDIPPETMVRKLAGHAARGQIDTTQIERRWTRAVRELQRRGEPLPGGCAVEPPEYPDVVPHFEGRPERAGQANRDRLAMKCEKCRERLAVYRRRYRNP